MNTFSVTIKVGPKLIRPDGTPIRRKRVTSETKPKYSKLHPQGHKPED